MHPSIPIIILIGGLNPTDVAPSSWVEADSFLSTRIDTYYPHATLGVDWRVRLKPEFVTQVKYPSVKVVQVTICEKDLVLFARTMNNIFTEREVWFMIPDSFRVHLPNTLIPSSTFVGQLD